MKAEILAVGTELLLGDIVNTNAQYLSRALAEMGIEVYHQGVIGDNEKRLEEALRDGFSRSDIIITTGGLGPTKDDLTKEVAAKYFNKQLVLDKTWLLKLEETFKKMNREVSEGNKKQAYIPEGSTLLYNNNGTAPGVMIEEGGKVLILLPGPPREMTALFEEEVRPRLSKYTDSILYSTVLRILGIGEGHMAEKIDHIISKQNNPTVAPYAKEGEVTLRITAKAKDEEAAKVIIRPVVSSIREVLQEDIYGEGDVTLEEVVAKLLIEKELTIATAESCTGGLLAGRLINYPGISKVFLNGVVTYSNEAKQKLLKVKTETLKHFGAVSEETAMEMARGVAELSHTDIGISTTGVAGPTGGTADKPVGLVYVGLYIKGEVKVKRLDLWGNRNKIRERAVINALDWLRRELNKI